MMQVFQNYNGSHFFDSDDQSVSYEFKVNDQYILENKKILKIEWKAQT
jgi:hypothetical protein